jgi:murein L,D-transpeptidase YcbB/YkuD
MNKLRDHRLTVFKLLLLSASFFIIFSSCNNARKDVSDKEIVETPEDINAKAEDVIRGTLKEILQNDKELPDSFKVKNAIILQQVYDQNSFRPLWSSNGKFVNGTDSLMAFIGHSKEYGLFPEDYYFTRLTSLKAQLNDTSREKKLDASSWAYSDLMLTSAFVQTIKDLKAGRLLPDSVIEKDSMLTMEFFEEQIRAYQQNGSIVFTQLEPQHTDYKKLKAALQLFLQQANFKAYTFVSSKDSTQLPKVLYKRLREEDSTLATVDSPDSVHLALAIKSYQKKKEMKTDGRISSALVNKLNNTDKEKFIRIAINLDRFKQLKPLPDQYIWVNLPSYYLQLRQHDSVALKSRVVVGKPTTRTPIISSSISDMITYPKWTIPESIVKKEILPGLKRDPGYTMRKGYSLVDENGNEINPYEVNWGKYKEGIPYKVVQGSGDDNALGVLKFNFPNEYSVYLHDTNQRYLFSREGRALSHGCVRVQAWQDLAKFILRNDSLNATNAVPIDSLESWLSTKQKRYIPVRKPIPLFIRYFTCDTNEEGVVVFYEDIYGEDKKIREKIFANK